MGGSGFGGNPSFPPAASAPASAQPLQDGGLPENQRDAVEDLMIDAICKRDIDRIALCLRKGARIDAVVKVRSNWGDTSLPLVHHAYDYYEPAVFELLLEAGMNINDKHPDTGASVLRRAIVGENARMVEILLKLGADVMSANNNNVTLLAVARSLNSTVPREKIIDLILEAFPDAGKAKLKEEFDMNAGPITLDKAIPPVKPLTFKPPPGAEP